MIKILKDRTVYIDKSGKVLGEVYYKSISFNTVDITHTFVEVSLRGKGLADSLLREAFKYFKENNIKVKLTCSYAKKWIEKNREYQNLII